VTTSVSVGVTTSSSGFVSSAVSSSGTGGVGACSDPTDFTFLSDDVIWPSGVTCAMANLNNTAADQKCLVGATGLTIACAGCLAQDTSCAINFCFTPCVNNPNSPLCATCRNANCLGSFAACSGRGREVGGHTCSTTLGGGPLVQPWVQGLVASDFTTQMGYAIYQKYTSCACSSCPQCQMDYCTGAQPANGNCALCISQQCGSLTATCEMN
jgi:hypothetical protein